MPKPSLIHNPTSLPPFSMVQVEGGSFLLEDKIKTNISTFYIGQHPVTQELWQSVLGDNPSHFHGKHRPVEQVSWYDAVEFCNQLSEIQGLEAVYEIDKSKKDPNNLNQAKKDDWGYDEFKWLITQKRNANGYRLPTEAEWEFAARGAIYSRGHEYAGSDDLDRVGWYRENSNRETFPVGLKRPNELGIYDMSGNIYEWCWDWYGAYMDTYMENPTGHISGERRVLRGGGWNHVPSSCRVARRDYVWPSFRYFNFGFRLSRTAI